MYSIRIKDRNGKMQENILSGITSESTGYEYGAAVAAAIEPFVKDRRQATAEIRNDGRQVIHRLAIVPKGGTVMVTENGADTIPLMVRFKENQEKLPEKYLVMVNPEKNNNKFYRMVDLGRRTWGAFYGRIGESQGESVYSSHVSKPYEFPDYMYAIKLQEKLLKGYRDMTAYHGESHVKKQEPAEFAGIEDKTVAAFVDRLMQFAQNTIRTHYTVASDDVTLEMIQKAKEELTALREANTLERFNKHLLSLMHIIPRRMDGAKENGVAAMMAKTINDFAEIILREESLLDVMEGQVKVNEQRQKQSKEKMDLLGAMGIELYVATPDQIEHVKKHLGDTLKSKLRNVYRAVNKRTQKAFDEYINAQEKQGVKVTVKEFWHGSRNENWVSILQNGLVLKPDAIITGKMFGQGIYFAPSAAKSWGYTSVGKWTKGQANTALMALYATAYGTPYEVYRHSSRWYDYNYQRLQNEHPGCLCVHAKADQGMLYHDEVIFYREDQMTISYICEFDV